MCTHAFHRRDSKDPDIHVLLHRWMLATKTHPACTIHEDEMRLTLWLDQKTITDANIKPSDTAGNTEEEEEEILCKKIWLTYALKDLLVTQVSKGNNIPDKNVTQISSSSVENVWGNETNKFSFVPTLLPPAKINVTETESGIKW